MYSKALDLVYFLFIGSLLEIFVGFKENTCLLEQQIYSLLCVLRKAGKCCQQ